MMRSTPSPTMSRPGDDEGIGIVRRVGGPQPFMVGAGRRRASRWTLVALGVLAAGVLVGPLGAQEGGGPIASPRDTARGTIGGAKLLVDYGRPSKRGRPIWGALVPWGQVWRTGANAATTFVTDKPLMIGTTAVPAGTYTLYTVPNQSGPWLLVVNKQTGQWGTEYHQEQDLARIPMTTSSISPVEKFQIAIGAHDAAGALEMQWDTMQAAVPVKSQ